MMSFDKNETIAAVQDIIGYSFSDTELLWEALQPENPTESTPAQPNPPSGPSSNPPSSSPPAPDSTHPYSSPQHQDQQSLSQPSPDLTNASVIATIIEKQGNARLAMLGDAWLRLLLIEEWYLQTQPLGMQPPFVFYTFHSLIRVNSNPGRRELI